jgi:uncharacterized protein YjbI with pentapeptide repeats
MANSEHLAILKQGEEVWNRWRDEQPEVQPDLSEADLSERILWHVNFSGANLQGTKLLSAVLVSTRLNGADLLGADLSMASLSQTNFAGANLVGAHFSSANLHLANLSEANLQRALLNGAFLSGTNLRGADLRQAVLSEANLHAADLSGANLAEASLERAILVDTNLDKANLSGCFIYGLSAWNVSVEGATQSNLVITPAGSDEPAIQVDNLEVAQFMYLLLNNRKIRHIIDTITSKVVLILGRFTPERKVILDAIRDGLRRRDYLPVLFDFEKPASRDLTETVASLAHMARFVIADITDAKSIPQELERIVPDLPSVPIQPLLLASQLEYGMFEHFRRYPWVLDPVVYESQPSLLAELDRRVISPAEAKIKEQTGRK